jgi:hypothetical protein
VYVLYVERGSAVTDIQLAGLVFSGVNGSIVVFHYFKYVSVSAATYTAMSIKGILNTALRTILVAYLVSVLKIYALLWICLSYLIGFGLYFSGLRFSRRKKRDDPLHYLTCHLAYGHFIALTTLFVAFPFAPNHSVKDWWRGYLVSECKMVLENLGMCVTVFVTIWNENTQSEAYFWALVFFVVAMALANLTSLWFIHFSVKRQLTKRKVYSNTAIVSLFHDIFAYHKHQMADREQQWQKTALELVGVLQAPTKKQGDLVVHPAKTHFDPSSSKMVSEHQKVPILVSPSSFDLRTPK